MRFAIDAHAIGCRLTGNEVYVRNLLADLVPLCADAEILAYLSGKGVNGWVPAGVQRRSVARNPFVRLGRDLSRQLRVDRPDLVHVQYTAPLACPVPVVVTVHDVSFLEHPEYFRPFRARQLRLTVRRTVRTAAKVITVSEFSRDAIARAYSLSREDIAVIPNAASALFRPIDEEKAAAGLRARFGIDGPVIFTVGDLLPRKNHPGLIRAFGELVRSFPQLKHRLVLAGKDTWYSPHVREAARDSGVADRIVFAGFVTDADLLLLYNACSVFVFPTFYEGFGLPVLEAMACGKAVACSNAAACPEVADAAALFFDPASTEQMVRAMADLLLDKDLRSRMGRLGLGRAAQFSWRRTAETTLRIYREVAGRHAAGKPSVPAAVSR